MRDSRRNKSFSHPTNNNNNSINSNLSSLYNVTSEMRVKIEFPALSENITNLKLLVEENVSCEQKRNQAMQLLGNISSFIDENFCNRNRFPSVIINPEEKKLRRFKSGLNLGFKTKSLGPSSSPPDDPGTGRQRRSTLSDIVVSAGPPPSVRKPPPKLSAISRDSNYLLSQFLLKSSKPPSILENGKSIDKIFTNIINLEVYPQEDKKLCGIVCGPDIHELEERYGHFASGQSISTYPVFNSKRTGDPICDRFYVQLYRSFKIISLADGCNWGSKPREAAVLACNEVMSYMAKKMQEPTLKNAKQIAQELLKAVMSAHHKILHTKSEFKDPGSTTLLCGITVKLKNTPSVHNKWLCICATLGDCKAFYYASKDKEFREITSGSRLNIQDISDCGGKLGSVEEEADLRNLMLYNVLLDKGDIMFACTDGLHDNLDPEQLGLAPNELGVPFATWKEAEKSSPDLVHSCKSQYMLSLIKKIVIGNDYDQDLVVTPHHITSSLINYCRDLTSTTRAWMENNPDSRQPKDQKKYPGKLDHTTCISLLVSKTPQHPFPELSSMRTKRAKRKFREFMDDPTVDLSLLRLSNTVPNDQIRSILMVDHKFYFTYLNLVKAPSISRFVTLLNLLPSSDQFEHNRLFISKPILLDQLLSTLLSCLDHPLKEVTNRMECIFKLFQNSSWMKYECFSEVSCKVDKKNI